MNRLPETEVEWEFLNGCDERELVDEVKLYKRKFNRLEALIQQTHGCHHSWVNKAVENGKEIERLRAENAGLRSRLTVLDAWASDLADSITSLRMRNIFPATEPGAGT